VIRPLLFAAVVVSACSTALAGEDPDPEAQVQDAFESVWMRVGHAKRIRLEQAQAAWAEYREATCQLYAARQYGIADDAIAQCFRYMSRERVAELEFMSKVLLDEEDEDDGC